jgi:hypothetical protein
MPHKALRLLPFGNPLPLISVSLLRSKTPKVPSRWSQGKSIQDRQILQLEALLFEEKRKRTLTQEETLMKVPLSPGARMQPQSRTQGAENQLKRKGKKSLTQIFCKAPSKLLKA